MIKKTKNEAKLDKIEEKRKAATTEFYLHCRGHATMALSKLHGSGFDCVFRLYPITEYGNIRSPNPV